MNFKEAAIKILSEAKAPLHYKEITERAIKQGLIKTQGSTPWATMNSVISTSIKKEGENSRFLRTKPGYYKYIPKHYQITIAEKIKLMADIETKVKKLTTKQKGDIAEARVAELITLYSDENLACYKPISDDEGIDIIVKRKNASDVCYIQVKASYGKRGFIASVKDNKLLNDKRMILVFVYYDLAEGDLFDQIFCIPAPDFKRLTKLTRRGRRTFTVGLTNPDRSKYAEFMIEKRELGNKIIEIMDKIRETSDRK